MSSLYLLKFREVNSRTYLSDFPFCSFVSVLSCCGFLLVFCLGGPQSRVGLVWAQICANATWVACAKPGTVPYSLSSGIVINCESISSSEVSSSDMYSVSVFFREGFLCAICKQCCSAICYTFME